MTYTGDYRQRADELDLISVIRQIIARKWFILITVSIFSLIALFYSFLRPDEYRAESLVQIEKKASNIALSSELVGELLAGVEQPSELETEFHVIKSRLILGEVVKDLNLNISVQPYGPRVFSNLYYRYSYLLEDLPFLRWLKNYLPDAYALTGERIEISDFVSMRENEEISFIISVSKPDHYSVKIFDVSDEGGNVYNGVVGHELAIGDHARINIAEIHARTGTKFTLTYVPVRDAAKALADELRVSERGGRNGTGIVDFSVTSLQPNMSIEIVNSVVREYQSQSLSRRSAEVDQSIRFIERQLPIADENLQTALTAFNSYIAASGAYSSLSSTTQDVLTRVVELETQLEEIGFQKSQLKTQVTESHPDFRRLEAQEEDISQRLIRLRDEMASVPETEQRLAQLTKNVQAARELREQLLLRLDQLRIVKASAVGTIRVLERAEDYEVSGPNRMRPIAVAAILGFVLASVLVLLKNIVNVGIQDEREIERLGLSTFATIPLVEKLRKAKSSDQQYVLSLSQPESLAVEALRALRTGLHFTLSAKASKAIAITSSAPNEGKSFISLNLAIVASQAGLKVLLVDADLRRGELHKSFGLSRRRDGLATYLAEGTYWKELVHTSKKLGVDFLANGGYPPNPSELLSSGKLGSLIDQAQEEYDLVILDCAPVLAVTDPAIVAGVGLPIFLVVSHLRTTLEEIEASCKAIDNVGVTFSGVIVNSYDQAKSRYGKNATKYGYYRGGYRYGYDQLVD